MTLSIGANHRLLRNSKPVERIAAAAAHTNGPLNPTPSILVMHFTFGGPGRGSANWFKDPNNTLKSSAHVVIDRDGSIIQCVDFNIGANHAGKSSWRGLNGLNDKALSIELANWGNLKARGSQWVSWTGVLIEAPVMAKHRNGHPADWPQGPIGWEPYPAVQVSTAIELARLLVAKYKIDEIVGHDDISVGRKWDPGPAFDMESFRSAVFGGLDAIEPNTLTVRSPGGLNLRKGPGMDYDTIVELPDGTLVQPVEQSGNWIMVNVLDQDQVPRKTGWVHRSFVA